MAETPVHFAHIQATQALAVAGADDGQTAILTDAGNPHIWRNGSTFFYPAVSKTTTDGVSFTYVDAAFDDATFYGDNVDVTRYIRHADDTNTLIDFTPDSINLTAGGVSLMTLVPATITLNAASADVDLVINGTAANLLVCDAGTNRVGVGIAAPLTKLHVYSETVGIDGLTIKNNSDTTTSATRLALISVDTGAGVANASFFITKYSDLKTGNYESTSIALSNATVFSIGGQSSDFVFDTGAASMYLCTTNIPRMTITAAGLVGIGVTPATYHLCVLTDAQIIGAEAGAATLHLWADEGDDAATDKWALSVADGGAFTFTQNSIAKLTMGGATATLDIHSGDQSLRDMVFRTTGLTHGVTDILPTDCHGAIDTASSGSATIGGMKIIGISDGLDIGITIYGINAPVSSVYLPPIVLNGANINGTTTQAVPAGEQLVGIYNASALKSFFEGDGTLELGGTILATGYRCTQAAVAATSFVMDRYFPFVWNGVTLYVPACTGAPT